MPLEPKEFKFSPLVMIAAIAVGCFAGLVLRHEFVESQPLISSSMLTLLHLTVFLTIAGGVIVALCAMYARAWGILYLILFILGSSVMWVVPLSG